MKSIIGMRGLVLVVLNLSYLTSSPVNGFVVPLRSFRTPHATTTNNVIWSKYSSGSSKTWAGIKSRRDALPNHSPSSDRRPSEDKTTTEVKHISSSNSGSSSAAFRRTAASLLMAAIVGLGNMGGPMTPLLSNDNTNVVSFPGGSAHAAESSRVIAEIRGSGLVFKDTLTVESFDDPKVQGVTLYISNFQRPLTERLQKNFFSDPSYASVGCAKTGPVKVADNIGMGTSGEEVFEESKSLLFKTLRVQRIYDKEKNTVVYVTFNTRLDKNEDTNKSRFKSSICAVSLE